MHKARIAIVTGAAVLGLGFFAAPAQASTTSDEAAAGTAPACIQRKVDNSFGYADITNKCGKTMHVNVIITAGPDSGCFSIANGELVTFQYLLGVYDKTVTC